MSWGDGRREGGGQEPRSIPEGEQAIRANSGFKEEWESGTHMRNIADSCDRYMQPAYAAQVCSWGHSCDMEGVTAAQTLMVKV